MKTHLRTNNSLFLSACEHFINPNGSVNYIHIQAMLKVKIVFVMVLIFLIIQNVFSQDIKREFERPINRSEVSEKVLQKLEPILRGASNIRFYREYDIETYSTEVKLKYKGDFWSIEFESDDRFKDAEKTLKRRYFRKMMNEKFHASLQSLGKKYKIMRVQKQYSWHEDRSDQTFDLSLFNEGNKSVRVRYELELEVVDMRSNIIDMEVLMSTEGEIIRKRSIEVLTPEHLLY